MIDWHRILGMVLTDYFTGTPYEVELEKDLSLKRQILDVAIIRKSAGGVREEICDGFEDLKEHNLLTYKSVHESLSLWVLEELIGYYVMYRKLIGKDGCEASRIGLYAVCTKYPRRLSSELALKELKRGVYEIKVLSCAIRIIVLREIERGRRNAIWNLFSLEEDKVRNGMAEYEWRVAEPSTIIDQLIKMYGKEGIKMAYTMEDFKKDYIRENLGELEPEERLKGLPVEERLKGVPAEERLKGLDAKEILKWLSPDIIEDYLDMIKKNRQG